MSRISANIWKLYLIKGLRCFMLTIPILVLFFQENGLSMKEIFLLQALFSLAIIVLEIPSGYFSDVFDRKISIVVGGSMAFLGFSIYSQSHGFWGFLLAEIVLGIGISFVSGADCAMLYDTLLEMGKQESYKKVEGKNIGIGLISESVASVMGGLLAISSLRLPLYCDALVSLFIIPVSFTLIEPKRKKIEPGKIGLGGVFAVLKFSLHEHKQVKWLIIYSSVIGAATLTMVWFIQPYLTATHVPLELFGVVWASLLFVAAVFSWNAHRVEQFLGRKNSLLLMLVLPVAGYFLLSRFWFVWSGVFILLFYVTQGINNPITLDYLNGLIDSDVRATILSVKNLVSRAIFVVVGPMVGWLSDAYSLKIALLGCGVTFLLFGSISLAFMKRHKVL